MPFLPIVTVYSVLIVFVMLYRTLSDRDSTNHSDSFDKTISPTSKNNRDDYNYLTLLLMILFSLAELNGALALWLHCIGTTLLISTIVRCMVTQSKYAQFFSNFSHIALIVGLGLINLLLCWPHFFRI
ncbi:hypothetical protein NBRC116188_17880 [Oceaniserpentilla sp. 4NH20-0058]